jgi:phosphoribosylanthranilate isomerase
MTNEGMIVNMLAVKICGITREEEIKYVNESLPDYIGLVFADSRRRVSIQTVQTLTSNLDEKIKKVGVFVNEEAEKIIETVIACSLDVVQLHGDETEGYIDDLRNMLQYKKQRKVHIWKAIRVKDKASLIELKNFTVDAFVLDTFVQGSYGGAGKVFDWKLAVDAKIYGNIILAGGLNCENVEEAIKLVKPFAVDVSSGVESDCCKDKVKVEEFINRVRSLAVDS